MNGFLPSWQNGSFVGGAVLPEMERLPAVHQDDVHGLARRVRVHGRDHLLRRRRAVEGSQSDPFCLLRYLSPSSQEEPSPTPCHRSLGEFLLKLCYNAELFSLSVQKDVLPRDLAAILDFMYHGEVNVKQDHLNSFLAVAERLRVRGLCQNDGGAPSSKGNKPGTPQVEKPKGRSLEAQATPPPLEPQLKRPRLVAPAADEDEVEELPPPQVKLEEGGTGEYKSSGGTRPPTSHYTEQQQQQYAMAEAGAYDESAHGSEYGDYSGYDEEMGYMEGGGVDPTQGSKGRHPSLEDACMFVWLLVWSVSL